MSLWVFEGDSGVDCCRFGRKPPTCTRACPSPDDALLAVGLVDGGITIWNVAGVRGATAELGAAW
ncbi:MAG: hypothetical protein U0836_18170 [Pirellulales bacterium]